MPVKLTGRSPPGRTLQCTITVTASHSQTSENEWLEARLLCCWLNLHPVQVRSDFSSSHLQTVPAKFMFLYVIFLSCHNVVLMFWLGLGSKLLGHCSENITFWQMLKCWLELWSLAWQPSRLQLHHRPPTFFEKCQFCTYLNLSVVCRKHLCSVIRYTDF